MINATYLNRQSPQLRKQNKIKTIHASLQIKGNTLTEEQVTALIENKRVTGPQKDVLEVKDYLNVFKDISTATASRDLKKGVELWRIGKIWNTE
jgi:Fic family protein